MSITILKGNIISAPALGELEITEKGYLVATDGSIEGVYQTLPPQFQDIPVEDHSNDLILQAFTDLHLHAPQYPMVGMGMDLPLLQWLDAYTFPMEAKFQDAVFARKVYRKLASELAENGTTRVCMFSSLHREATLVLMEELENAGICGYVGKVNMDRNGSAILQETTEESIEETLLWLEQCSKFKNIRPIITPRFTPACSAKLMQALGEIAARYQLPVQSHLSENQEEVQWVASLHPECSSYWETYAKHGLWNERTLMAHCVWSDEEERKAMRDGGITVVHCPDSNQNLLSGIAPVRQMLQEGLQVGLGTDIAGGDHISMFDATVAAIQASKIRRILDHWETDFLTVAAGWYLATSAGAEFFGEKPGFAAGNSLHAIGITDDALPDSGLTVQERFERCIYRRQKDAIRAVYSNGKKIFEAP